MDQENNEEASGYECPQLDMCQQCDSDMPSVPDPRPHRGGQGPGRRVRGPHDGKPGGRSRKQNKQQPVVAGHKEHLGGTTGKIDKCALAQIMEFIAEFQFKFMKDHLSLLHIIVNE